MQAALSRIVDWLICSLAAMAIGLAAPSLVRFVEPFRSHCPLTSPIRIGFSSPLVKGFHTMLVLTRQENESIELTIPPSTETRLVTVTVTRIRGSKVRIATEAPKEIGIDRSELKPATAS